MSKVVPNQSHSKSEEVLPITAYVLVEYCCNHFQGVFRTYEEALAKHGYSNEEELNEGGFSIFSVNI